MARGILAGAVAGGLVSVVAAGVLSVWTGPPETPRLSLADPPGTAEPPSPGSQIDTGGATDSAATPAEDTGRDAPADPDRAPADGTAEAVPAQSGEDTMDEATGEAAGETVVDAPDDAAAATARDAADAAVPSRPAVPPARRPAPERGVALPGKPARALSDPDDAAALPGADTAPAALPRAETDTAALTAPDAPGGSGRIAVDSDAPVLPGVSGDAPAAPLVEDDPAIATEPAQPPLPDVPDDPAGLVADPDADPDGEAQADRPGLADEADSSGLPVRDDAANMSAGADAAAADEQTAFAAPAPGGPVPVRRGGALPGETSRSAEAPDGIGSAAMTLAEDPARPRVGRPATSLLDRDPAVPVRRSVPGATAPSDDAGQAESAALPRPIERFAAPLAADPEAPRMAIVLIDDGAGPLGPAALADLPFPVTIALAPGHPQAEAAASAYRGMGHEILALADFPVGARASDVEIALEGILRAVPDAVGVLDAPGASMQTTRSVSDQATAFLGATGHGLVLMPTGLNLAETMARRRGVPATTVFRDLDAKGQDPRVIRRFLEQAAFKARQEGEVVMLGRLRPDTLSALLIWGQQDRDDNVAKVPVSAVLLDDPAEG